MENNVSQFRRELFNPKVEKLALLNKAKNQKNIDTIFTLLKECWKHPQMRLWMEATPFPKLLTDLHKDKLIGNTNNLAGELAWNLFPVLEKKEIINAFLPLKKQFEAFLLLGKYDDAKAALTSIEAQFGYSVWSIENSILLEENRGGTEANWLILSDYANKLSDGLLLFFAEQFSKKDEDKIGYTRYKDLLFNQVDGFELPNEFKEYLLYKLNFVSVKEFYNHAFCLYMESTLSLIDRYLMTRIVMAELISEKKFVLFKKLINHATGINDLLIPQFENYLEPNEIKIFQDSQLVFNFFDLYTVGNYEECMNRIPSVIIANPSIIELYDIYIKSNVELCDEFVDPKISDLTSNILSNLFILYSKKIDSSKATAELLKIVSTNFAADWAKQLLGLVNYLCNINKIHNVYSKFYLLFSQINNPKRPNDIDEIWSDQHIQGFRSTFPNSITLDVLEGIYSGISVNVQKINNIPIRKKELYILKSKFNSGNFIDVAEDGLSLLNKPQISGYIIEETLLLVFNSNLRLKRFSNALLLYVDYYFKNPQQAKRLDSDILLSEIADNFGNLSDFIELPIFYSLTTQEPYDVYVAYDEFMIKTGFDRPSRLIDKKNVFEIEKLVYFFKEVCQPDILKHSFVFSSKEEIDSERLFLLDELLKLDKKNEVSYIKEITSITQNAAIKNVMREVNKGRITINVDQLKNVESNNIKDGFTRYIELANFSKNRNIQGIDISGKQLSGSLNQLSDGTKSKLVYTNDPAFISFKLMFVDIRDKFLLSKEFGLDGYLSTRIRHGTFQNYIRSVFEAENLISQKKQNGEYLDIDFWNNKIPNYQNGVREPLQKAIHKFSKNVDDYTEHVIKELIQVKTERHIKKPLALFDYSFEQPELAKLFQIMRERIKDHKTFIEFIFLILNDKTEMILESIRSFMKTSMADKFSAINDELLDAVRSIFGSYPFPELYSAIMRCNTNLRKEITNISEWFYVANPTTDLILDLNTVIQTSIQITNRIYPYRNINPTILIQDGLQVKGSLNLVYIFRILLDNILQHSKLDNSNLNIIIDVKASDELILEIDFTNNFDTSCVDLDKLNALLAQVKDRWHKEYQDYERIDIEGGSGFDKIRRILTFDMRNAKHSFEYSLKDDQLTIKIFLKMSSND